MINYTKSLYAKDQHGSIRVWRIDAIISDTQGELRIYYGVVDGDMVESFEIISEGLAGRTIEEQTLLRFNSRISRKIDAGYVEDIDSAINNKRVNILGLKRPMLAAKYDDMRRQIPFKEGVFIQRKYNGFRCLIANNNGVNIAYSRNGKEIEAINHIIDRIEIPNGTILDGELYCHSVPFQTISSWIKRKQKDTLKIKYIIYDIISDLPYSKRLYTLKNMERSGEINTTGGQIEIAETNIVYSDTDAKAHLRNYIAAGYEGAIIRVDGEPYQDGKRSKSLIKMKQFFEDEFLVVGIDKSAEGWAILNCITKDGKTFSVSAPGTKYEKEKIYQNREMYIGRMVNVEYSEWTKYGKPFHPIATFFRDKGAE